MRGVVNISIQNENKTAKDKEKKRAELVKD